MQISFDPRKRQKTLDERGLDFADADKVFAATTATAEDRRKPYPERRYITAGLLAERVVVLAWTPTAEGRENHLDEALP